MSAPPPTPLWAERTSPGLRWVLTTIALVILAEQAWSAFDGSLNSRYDLTALAFALVALLPWWRFDALALGLALPLATMIAEQDARFSVFVLAPLVGIVTAMASRVAFLVSLGMTAVWVLFLPSFAPEDADAAPIVVVLLLIAVAIGLVTRRRGHAASQDRFSLAERERLAQESRLAEREAADEVRRSVSRDLHDVVAHALTVIKLQSEVASFTSDTAKMQEALASISDASQHALTDLRAMLRFLEPRETDKSAEVNHGARAAADERTASEAPSTLRLALTAPNFADLLRDFGFPTTLTIGPRLDWLSRGEEVILHRLLQESTTNVLKHAKEGTACSIELGVRVDGEPWPLTWVSESSPSVWLRVTNEVASGTSPDRTRGRESGQLRLGLSSMRQRVEAIGGRFGAGERNGRWIVEAALPIRLPSERSAAAREVAAQTAATSGPVIDPGEPRTA